MSEINETARDRITWVAGLVTTAALVFALLPATAGAVDTLNWKIDANSLRTDNIQEDGFFSDGDEPYIAVVGFRSRFGTPGSTAAAYRGGLRELSSGADDGDLLSIPDSMGRMNFPTVTRLSAANILSGAQPELIGTITVAMESDATPFSSMDTIFSRLATVAKQEIAAVIETTPVANVGSTTFANRVANAIDRIESRTRLSFWQQLGIFLSSWGDPDDKIASKINAFVAVDSSLASVVDTQVGAVIPSSEGKGGALRSRTHSLTFSGDGARYTVNYAVGAF